MRISDMIYGLVKLPDVLQKYHHLGRGNRIDCPIHHGKDHNFCYTDEVFHCWSCGAKGNVISFVMQLFDISFNDAAVRINNDFGLGLPFNKKLTMREKQEFRRQNQARKEEIRRIKAEKEKKVSQYWDLMGEWIRLDNNRAQYTPKNQDEDFHPLYCEAIHKIPHVEYKLDVIDWR